MAEEETSDDIAVDKEGQDKIFGLPKKIFFIVISVVVTLIIAANAYLLLTGKDKVQHNPQQAIQNQTLSASDNLLNPANASAQSAAQLEHTDKNDELRTQLFVVRGQVIHLKEENLILIKEIFDLVTKQPQARVNNNASEPTRRNPYNTEDKDFPPIDPYVPIDNTYLNLVSY